MLTGESLNITQDNLDKLQAIFPNIFSEGNLDMERFNAMFRDNISLSNERYVLNWAGKSDAFKTLQVPTTATLKPMAEEGVHFDTTGNVFIEGENLEVLKLLQKSYYNKIKCIIIDPPYNTGSDSFIYPDSFKENKIAYEKRIGDKDEEGFLMKESNFKKNSKDSGHYHSNWLSMMYPRLFLAKNLLKDDGVIFVHIDDNEVHNLRLLMNEIFGEENFVANIIWEKKFAPSNDAKWFSDNHDHILAYSKNKDFFKLNLLKRNEEALNRYKNPDNDIRGVWVSGDMTVKTYNASYDFEITTPSGRIVFPPKGICWRFSKQKVAELIEENRIWFGENGDNVPRLKRFLSEVKDGITPLTIWYHKDVAHNQEAAQELRKLFEGELYFETPKPVRLIKRIAHIATKEDDIILDFFAGSGTTAQAVLELNKKDGGNRKFILVQLPEPCDESSEAFKAGYKTIADISRERIRRVIKKMEKEKADKPDMFDNGQLDLGFKAFKLTASNFKIWQGNDITEDNLATQLDAFANPVKEESQPHNMLFELMLKAGYLLTEKVVAAEKYYSIKDGELIIALEEINETIIEAIITAKPVKLITLDNLFAGNDQLKTNTVLQMKDAGIDFKTI